MTEIITNTTTGTTNPDAILDSLRLDVRHLLADFLAECQPSPGSLMVVGCSTSEVLGGRIGKNGSAALGEIIAAEVLAAARSHGIHAAAQCCEHLNRALVIERAEAERRGFTIVSAVPKPHAGGSFGAAFYLQLADPVLVETISADCGIDIGQTLIGMHLKRVAVPIRLSQKTLGSAVITAAKTRPALIGGERARYI